MRFLIADDEGYLLQAGHSTMLPPGAKEVDDDFVIPRVPPGFRFHIESGQLVDARTDEQAWQEVRSQRQALLAACDWVVLPDSSVSQAQREAWVAYRQVLRDITDQPDPRAIVWPVAPTN